MQMRAIAATAFGGTEHLKMIDLPAPDPAAGEVRIAVRAASFNPVDFKRRKGAFGDALPLVLGMDVAGVVDAVGPGVSDFRPGDNVWCFLAKPAGGVGGYAQFVCSPAEFVAPLPRTLAFHEAAALPVAALTAYECVHLHAQARPGQSALVVGAAGGVGTFALQLLRHAGVETIFATAGSAASTAHVEALGVPPHHVLDYRAADQAGIVSRLRQLTGGRGVDLAFDFYGGPMKPLCCAAVVLFGRVVTIVEEPEPLEGDFNLFAPTPDGLFFKSATFHFEFLMSRAYVGPRSSWADYAREMRALNELIDAGAVRLPKVETVGGFDPKSVAEAHRRLEDGHVQGKLVMRVE